MTKHMVLALIVVMGWLASGAQAQEPGYSDAWGPAAGSRLPLLDAVDQSGERVSLGDLTGRRGLLLVLVRSADW